MRVFISAGEASGDAYGAALIREIRRLTLSPLALEAEIFAMMKRELEPLQPFDPDASFRDTWDVDSMEDLALLLSLEQVYKIKIPEQEIADWGTSRDVVRSVASRLPTGNEMQLTFEGVGGPRMMKEGATLHADSSKWGAISIAQAARVFWRVFTALQGVKRHLRKDPPGLFVPIDFGFANIRIAKYAKKRGWKVLYFVPPGSWRRDRQGKDLPAITDAIVTPFEWSARILNEMGAHAHWFGHPIKQLILEANVPEQPRTTIAALPGSREHELEMNLPLIAETVTGQFGDWTQGINISDLAYADLPKSQPAIPDQIEFALAPTVDLDEFKRNWARLAPGRDDLFTVGDTYGVLKRAKVGIVCSGTATLEAAICRCPLIVIYQISPSMRREVRLLRIKRPRFVALPNILADKRIVPELTEGDGVHPAKVRIELDPLLNDEEARNRQLRDFEALDLVLGPADGITKTAELALSLIGAIPS